MRSDVATMDRLRIKRGYGCRTARIDGTDMRIKRGTDEDKQ